MATKRQFDSQPEARELWKSRYPHKTVEEITEMVAKIWSDGINKVNESIPAKYQKSSLSDFKPHVSEAIMRKAWDVFCPPKYDNTDKIGIIFTGDVGRGKTYLAYALLKRLAEMNPEMISWMGSCSGAMRRIKDELNLRNDESRVKLIDVLTNYDDVLRRTMQFHGMIFMDDLSAKQTTEFESDIILQILDSRIDHFQPMLITTNLKMEEFESVLGDRIASRLSGNFHIVDLDGIDRRLEDAPAEK